jgi:hypothetical protein
MPCLVAILALAFPRIVLFVLWLFTDYLQRAYDSMLLLIAGFLFLPLTTLVYAWIVNSGAAVAGWYLIALIVAVILDAGGWGGASRGRRKE